MKSVVYFCLEYALESLPFAGGLGILAGDLVLQAQQDGWPLTAVGLAYQEPGSDFTKVTEVAVEVGDREITVPVWEARFGSVRLLLLGVSGRLYDLDSQVFFDQQIVLGIGGVRTLRKLNIPVDVWHLNEGHTAAVILELWREAGSLEKAVQNVVGTKHTIFTGAGLHLTKAELTERLALFLQRSGISVDELFAAGTHPKHPKQFSMTNFLLSHAARVSGVSFAHVYFEKIVHPESRLIPITNGVFPGRWQETRSHSDCKKELIWRLNKETGSSLEEKKLLVVWARRLVAYKRPELLLNNLEKLASLPIQVVISGEKIDREDLGSFWEKLAQSKVVFWPNYDQEKAKLLTAGADVWLFTSKPGLEACGTSGMKAGLNGVLPVFTNDGWYQEVDFKGLGWEIPEENIKSEIYRVLGEEVAPVYYNQPQEWAKRQEKMRRLISERFTTARVLREYQEKLYLSY